MNHKHAIDKITKLRAHADSVHGTPEAALYRLRANDIAREHGLPVTTDPRATSTTGTAPVNPVQPRTKPNTSPTTRRTTVTTTATKTAATRSPGDPLHLAFAPRTPRAAFGRNSQPGDEILFHIVRIDQEPDTDYVTKAVKKDDDGNPIMVATMIVQTDGSTRVTGQGLRKLWIRSGIADALVEACVAAGVRTPVVGGSGVLRYLGEGEPYGSRRVAPKLFEATYQPPIDQETC
ncbi:MAG: hypothetical protein HOQ24_12165 [Mycobacteriaceae bacterium]|nr:hypothetical protein [Mycobacteriaceae bacterium]